MKLTQPHAILACLVLVHCTNGLEVSLDAAISCQNNEDCPEPLQCLVSEEICVRPSVGGNSAPRLLIGDVNRAVGSVEFPLVAFDAESDSVTLTGTALIDGVDTPISLEPAVISGEFSGSSATVTWPALNTLPDTSFRILSVTITPSDDQTSGDPASVEFPYGNDPPEISEVVIDLGVGNRASGLVALELAVSDPNADVLRIDRIEFVVGTERFAVLDEETNHIAAGQLAGLTTAGDGVGTSVTLAWDSSLTFPERAESARLDITVRDDFGGHATAITPPFSLVNQSLARVQDLVSWKTFDGDVTGPIPLGFTLIDEEADLSDVRVEFRTPDSRSWLPCTELPHPRSVGTTDLATYPVNTGGISHAFYWDASRDVFGSYPELEVRIVPRTKEGVSGEPALIRLTTTAPPLDAVAELRITGEYTVPRSALVAFDISGDGVDDLLFVGSGSSGGETALQWLEQSTSRGEPTGQFDNVSLIDSGSHLLVGVGDIDGDSILDFVTQTGSGMSVYIGGGRDQPNGLFEDAVVLPVDLDEDGGAFFRGVLRDANEDARADVVVGETDERQFITYLGTESGPSDNPITSPWTHPGNSNGITLAAGQFVGNSSPDVAIAESGDSTVYLYQGEGNGQFLLTDRTVSSPFSFIQDIWAGDLNQDGLDDFVLVENSNRFEPNVAVYFATTEAGRYEEPLLYTVFPEALSISPGDFNGDGLLDLAINSSAITREGGVSLLVNLGPGVARDALLPVTGVGGIDRASSRVAVGRFNSDEREDLAFVVRDRDVFNRRQLAVVEWQGGSTTDADLLARNLAAPTQLRGAVVADIDHNGSGDFITSEEGASAVTRGTLSPTLASVIGGLPTGEFEPGSPMDGGINPNELAFADLNSDGLMDAVALNNPFEEGRQVQDPGVRLFISTTPEGPLDAAATQSLISTAPADPRGLLLTRLNGDPHVDIVTTSDSNIVWFPGIGDGMFSPPEIIGPAGPGSFLIRAGDFNGDGRTDITFPREDFPSGTVRVALFTGSLAGFVDAGEVSCNCGGGLSDAAVGDVDGDGIDDLVVVGAGIRTLSGGPSGFSLGRFTDGIDARAVRLTDFDEDGTLDLVVAGVGALEVFLNDKIEGLAADFYPASLSLPIPDINDTRVRLVDLHADGRADYPILGSLPHDVFLRRTASLTPSSWHWPITLARVSGEATLTRPTVDGTTPSLMRRPWPGPDEMERTRGLTTNFLSDARQAFPELANALPLTSVWQLTGFTSLRQLPDPAVEQPACASEARGPRYSVVPRYGPLVSNALVPGARAGLHNEAAIQIDLPVAPRYVGAVATGQIRVVARRRTWLMASDLAEDPLGTTPCGALYLPIRRDGEDFLSVLAPRYAWTEISPELTSGESFRIIETGEGTILRLRLQDDAVVQAVVLP